MSNLFSSGGAGNVGFSGETQQSLKFNDDESQYLSWTPAAAGNRKTWTWSGWVKRATLSTSQIFFGVHDGGSQQCWLGWNSGNTIQFFSYQGSTIANVGTQAVFRDVSAWYHLVVAFDAANTTMNMYINGVDQTLTFDTAISNTNHHINNSSYVHGLGRAGVLTGNDADMYLSDVYFIDGQALDATSFGETVDGYWKAKDYSGTYGTNGFRLTFEDDVVSEGFNTVTYRGTGAAQSISGLGFEPDFVWMKRRTADDHDLQDSVRGGGKTLMSHSTAAETDLSGSYGINSFDADGFSLVGNGGRTNESGGSYVAWCWDAGTGSAASNTDGSITSSVKANTAYGFSIVSYTGTGVNATVGHGLSSAPEMIIIKDRGDTSTWIVYTEPTGNNNLLVLASTSAATSTTNFQSTDPTSSVFSVSTSGAVNGSSSPYIAYCFHSVAGYSSIGSYSGTGASGNAVTCGFRPAFVMYKKTNGTGSWIMQDNTRSPVNPVDKFLYANESDAEYSGSRDVDFLSNGFEIKSDAVNINQSGKDYIYMAFADTREAAFWKDVSGQGNHWTPNNLDYRDSLLDSPANNFAVLNPLVVRSGTTAPVFSEGNLKVQGQAGGAGSVTVPAQGSINFPSSGKHYFEVLVATDDNTNNYHIGVVKGYTGSGLTTNSQVYYREDGQKNIDGTSSSYGATYTADDIVGVAVDIGGDEVEFFKNGASQGTISHTLDGDFAPMLLVTPDQDKLIANFGQDSTFAGATTAGGNQDDNGVGDFKYAPPAGFLALCTSNLPTPTIVDGSEYFNPVLYTGTGATQSITGVGFQPDFVWMKSRSSALNHMVFDSVRGASRYIQTSTSAAEGFSSGNFLSSFDSDGFTLQGQTAVNKSGDGFAAWNWLAGGTAVSNTDGSITSQVSANTDAGFSIVSYTGNGVTGATVGHSLGVKPDMFIVKNRTSSGVNDWSVYHSSLTATHRAYLYKTDAAGSTSAWNNTEPTSSVFTIKNFSELNSSGDEYIAYCFANTDGYLKAGSYTGNGSTDGPFVYTGFRPAWVVVKRTDAVGGWYLLDNKRSTGNPVEEYLQLNTSSAEATTTFRDHLSNGFKVRNTFSNENASGGTYIYLAFAESPFKYANAR